MEFVSGEWLRSAFGVPLEFAQRREQLRCVIPSFLRRSVGHPDQLPQRVGTGIDAGDARESVSESPEVAIAFAIRWSMSRETSAIFAAIACASAGDRTLAAINSACAASTSRAFSRTAWMAVRRAGRQKFRTHSSSALIACSSVGPSRPSHERAFDPGVRGGVAGRELQAGPGADHVVGECQHDPASVAVVRGLIASSIP
jgi:hypothetical protein